MKRTIVLFLAAITAYSCLYAQASKNPFTKLGYKKQVVYSSSKGEFDEFHDQESVIEIGSVYFNTKTNKVVGLISEEGKQENVNPATTAMSVDPLCEKYYWISPYAYCLNNPVKYIDPDGQVVRLADNTTGGLNNLAKIAATNKGQGMLNNLIRSGQTYSANSVFFTRSSSYDNDNNEINYVRNTSYNSIDGGSASNEVIMGHEFYHAFQDNNHQIKVSDGVVKNRLEMERGSVSFENYLRNVFGDTQLRKQYSGLVGGQEGQFSPFNMNTDNEHISNFTSLGNNSSETSFGFSFDKTANNQPMQTNFIVVSIDKNKNFNYNTFKTKEEFTKATANW